MRDAVLLLRLRGRQLVVAAELELPVDDVEDRIRTPIDGIEGTASRTSTSAPLVREDDLGPVVVERGGVPVGEGRVDDRVQTDGICRIGDVEEDAVAGASARGRWRPASLWRANPAI